MDSQQGTALELPEFVQLDHIKYAVSLFSDTMLERFKAIPDEYLELPEKELEELVGPTQVDRSLRLRFWAEVNRVATNPGAGFSPVRIYNGVCNRANFYNRVICNPAKFAFLLHTPKSYDAKIQEMVDFGIDKLRNALDAKIIFPNGHLDAKAAKTVLDIVTYFEARVRGPIKQKVEVEQTNKNFHVHAKVSNPTALQDLDKKLEELRQKIATHQGQELVQGLPDRVVDVKKSE